MQKILVILALCVALGNNIHAQSAQESKPSFNCTKTTTKIEKMICSDSSGELQNLDRYMAEVYTQLKKELRKSHFPDKKQRLKKLVESQRAFLKENLQYDEYALRKAYKMHTIHLLKLLGKVLDSNNKELCESSRQARSDEDKWREIPKSTHPPFSIGLCAFGRNNRNVDFTSYCTQNGEIKKDEAAKAIKEESPYIEFPKSFERWIDIDNDGVLENVIYTRGEYFGVLWIYKNGKLDEKASDRIYGDDLHFSGAKTSETVCMTSEEACMALATYALPTNKISQRLEFYTEGDLMPILSYLSYEVMEFEGKNYIILWNNRFFWDTYRDEDENGNEDKEQEQDFIYPATRIYLLEGNKRELKCTY